MTIIQPLHALGRLKLKLVGLFGDDIASYPIGHANLLPESSSFLDTTGEAWQNITQIVSQDGGAGFFPHQVMALTRPYEGIIQLVLLLEDNASPSGYSTRFIEQDFDAAVTELVALDVDCINRTHSAIVTMDDEFNAFELRWLNHEQSVPRIMQRANDTTDVYKFQNIAEVLECYGSYGFDISDIAMVSQAPFSPNQHSLVLVNVPDQKLPETYIIYAPYDAVMQELSAHAIEMVELPVEQEAAGTLKLAGSRHFLGERLLKALRPDVSLQAPRFPDNIF